MSKKIEIEILENLPISSSTGQHLVDTDNVEGVDTDPHVERILARGLGDVLVGTNTGSLESLARELLVLIGDKMAAEGEVINGCTFTAQVEDSDLPHILLLGRVPSNSYTHLWVGDTTVIA